MSHNRFLKYRDRIRSFAGGWTVTGNASLLGYDIHEELVPNISWMQSMLLAITGRLYPRNEAQLIEAMYIATGYPDPRIWCNRVAALAGTARASAAASLSAGIASSESKLFGKQADYFAAQNIQKANQIFKKRGKAALQDFVENTLKETRVFYGFGRPLTRVEERIVPIEKKAQELGIIAGDHLTTARFIEKFLKKRRIIMNYAGYAVSRLLDMKFSTNEIYRTTTLAFYVGLLPCYIEAFENEPGTFLPIACDDILYGGVNERPLPDK